MKGMEITRENETIGRYFWIILFEFDDPFQLSGRGNVNKIEFGVERVTGNLMLLSYE